MSIRWDKGTDNPVNHLEKLIHEIVNCKDCYHITINEQRTNGKIISISMEANSEELKNNE